MVKEGEPLAALKIETFEIDNHYVGDRWTIQDIGHLVKLISPITLNNEDMSG